MPDPANPKNADQLPPPAPVDHSMKDEPETGWDTAPNNIQDPKAKRHPKTEGKGGTPD